MKNILLNLLKIIALLLIIIFIMIATSEYNYLLLTLFLIIFATPGYILAKLYLMKKRPSQTFAKVVAWISLITWIFPIIGLPIATSAYFFFQDIRIAKKKYRIIAIIGILLSVTNSFVGMYRELN